MKFSIRELMVLTLAVVLGIGWVAERNRLNEALKESERKAQEAKAQAKELRDLAKILAIQEQRSVGRTAELERQISQIEKQLPAHGVELWPQGDTGRSGPLVKRRYPAH